MHFPGPAGAGKTTLALHTASKLGRPTVMMFGDDQMGSGEMVGGLNGYHRRRVVDNFIHTVLKTEDELTQRWADNRLTFACQYGLTLIYDEFTRSRPEANNVLLSVLEERLLPLPIARRGQGYLRVHPDFRVIFTSNPNDYVGVHKTQDALRDRMITVNLNGFDELSEAAITAAKAGISREEAGEIVELVRRGRQLSDSTRTASVRASIALGRAVRELGIKLDPQSAAFRQVCTDILGPQATAAALREWREGGPEADSALVSTGGETHA